MRKVRKNIKYIVAGRPCVARQIVTPAGRKKECRVLLSHIQSRKSLHIHGPGGTGKSALLDWTYGNWQQIDTPLIPIYCRSSRTLRQILLCMATFLLDYFKHLESVDKFKQVKEIRYPSDIKTLSVRVLRNIVYDYISQGNFCIILDHLEYVTPKINGFLNVLYERALVITASRHSWELADYSFTGRLDYCLYLVPKLRLDNLNRKESFALMERLSRNLNIGLSNMREMIYESYRISKGNPRVISTIFEKAQRPKYRKDSGVNLGLIMIDFKMSELAGIDGLREVAK